MMQIVIPKPVQIITSLAARAQKFCFLRFVLRYENKGAISCRGSSRSPDCAHNIFLGRIEDALGGIETKSVEVKFLDPITAVRNEEFPDRSRVRAVKVDGGAPVVLVSIGKIVVRKDAEVV